MGSCRLWQVDSPKHDGFLLNCDGFPLKNGGFLLQRTKQVRPGWLRWGRMTTGNMVAFHWKPQWVAKTMAMTMASMVGCRSRMRLHLRVVMRRTTFGCLCKGRCVHTYKP